MSGGYRSDMYPFIHVTSDRYTLVGWLSAFGAPGAPMLPGTVALCATCAHWVVCHSTGFISTRKCCHLIATMLPSYSENFRCTTSNLRFHLNGVQILTEVLNINTIF